MIRLISNDREACKEKSVLKKRIQLEMSKESITNVNINVIDGSAPLWTIRWPLDGTVEDALLPTSSTAMCTVYLIFDRYHDTAFNQLYENRE